MIQTNKLLFLFLFISVNAFAQSYSSYNFEKLVADEQRAHRYINNTMLSLAGNNYDVKYNRCEWTIDPAVYYIKGGVTTYFSSNISSLNQIIFDLSDSLNIDSVIYHGSTLTYAQVANDGLVINLPAALPLNAFDSISVYYQGVPPPTGFGSFIQDTHNSTPIIWTLSEPFGASDWWPCKNSLIDKIDSIDIIVATPLAYRDGSNGVLVSEITSGNNKIYHWKSHNPIASYLVSIAVTNYSVYSNWVPIPGDSIQVLNYVYPEDSATAASQTPDIIPTIQLYDSLTILYPFWQEKYGHCQFGWGGGMEHQTMTYCVIFDHFLIAHECAHQWFGDKVTCGSWQDIWLNEGFATYFEGLSEEFLYPSTWYSWKSGKISSITAYPDGSVMCDDTTNVNRIFNGVLTYNKGGYLLHMLRWKMGDTNFFQALKDYLNDPQLAYNFAKTPDLKAHLEAASGLNLTNFFNEWYYNQGWPTYQVRWNKTGTTLYVKISQTQSHPSVTFFVMPVPIRFQGPGLDTILVFDHTFSGQLFSRTIPQSINSVTFDPDLWLLSANNTVTYDATIGIDEIDVPLFFDACPNPFTNVLSLKGTHASGEVILYDLAGKEIMHQQTSEVETILNTENIAAGLYMFSYKQGDEVRNIKVIKEE